MNGVGKDKKEKEGKKENLRKMQEVSTKWETEFTEDGTYVLYAVRA